MTIGQSDGIRKDNSIDYDEVGRLIDDIVNTSDKFDRVKRDLRSSFLEKIIKTLQRVDKESLKKAGEKAYSKLRKLMLRIKHAWNRLNTKENREKAKDVAQEIAEYFDDYDYILYNKTLQKATTPINTVVESQQPTTESSRAQQGAAAQINIQEGNFKSFIQEILEIISDLPPEFKEKISEILNNLFETSEQQITEVPQTTEDQQVATEVPQVTEKQQNTKKQQVMNKDGDTALHLAAMKDDLNTVKYLVEKGVEVDVKNKYGATPLHVASIRGNLEIAQFLLDHGADVNAQVVNGLTPLNWATIHDHLAMVKLLLDHCADVNIKEGESDAAYDFGYGRTPLISAVVACNTEIARLLLDNGADVSIKGRGLTALDFANTNKDKCPEMLALLKDGNIKNSDSRSHCTFTMATSSATKPSFLLVVC